MAPTGLRARRRSERCLCCRSDLVRNPSEVVTSGGFEPRELIPDGQDIFQVATLKVISLLSSRHGCYYVKL